MFLRNNLFLYVATMFVALTLVILPTQAVFANEESDKHNSQGNTYYNSEKYDDAIKEFTAAIAIEDNNPVYYNNRGWAYLNSSKNDEALVDFNKTIQLEPDYANAYSGRASVYLKKGETDEAKINFKRAALIYIDRRDYDDAAEELNSAIEADNNYGEAYYYLGLIENRRNNYQKAIHNYDEAIRLGYIEGGYVYNGIGYAKYHLGRYEDAIQNFDKAIEKKEDYAEAYQFRGESHYSLHDYKKAAADFEKYLELDEDIDEITRQSYLEKIKLAKTTKPDTSKLDDSELDDSELDDTELDDTELDDSELDDSELGTLGKICKEAGIGHVNKLLKALFIVMALEYMIIICCGIKERNLTAGGAARGFAIKIILLIIVIVANAMEEVDALDEFDIRDVVVAIILIHEVLSILENAERLGIPVPDWLKNLLQNIKDGITDFIKRIFGSDNRQS